MDRCERKIIRVLSLLILCTSLLLARGKTITILHVNDTHSHLDAFGPKDIRLDGTLGGIAKAATVIDKARGSESHVILLHVGDLFHGDLFFNKFFGVPELQFMQQLKFDAMAIGNHEFDLGPDVLVDSLQKAFGTPKKGFRILSANLDIPATHPLREWIQSGVVVRKADIKFGIFGMTVPDDPTTRPDPVRIMHGGMPSGFPAGCISIASRQGRIAQRRSSPS